MSNTNHSSSASPDQVRQETFHDLVLEVFEINGLFLAWGNELTAPCGLTSALWHVLGAVSQGPMTQAGIARRMGLTRQSVRRSAQLLEERGMVEFLPNQEHKRAHLVRLTEYGQETVDTLVARWNDATRDIYRDIPLKEMEHAVRLLRELCNRLDGTKQGDNE